jgi:hypothetical protein
MHDLESKTRAFFRDYSARNTAALQEPPQEDVEGTVACFAPFFVEASPKGVIGGANDDTLRQMIPKGFEHYRSVGGTRFEMTGIEVTVLDAFNVMARTDWAFGYRRRTDGQEGEITFRNIYFLNFADGDPKIFAFVTPDEEAAMKKHGLA